MKRRTFMERAALAAAALPFGASAARAAASSLPSAHDATSATGAAALTAPTVPGTHGPKPVLTIGHITDIHIEPANGAPALFRKCMDQVLTHKVDFFLNGGDSIMAADYKDITRDRVTELWTCWDECRAYLKGYDIYSCIGNHDTWWAAPSHEDEMYGKDYVVKRLGMPNRYFSFNKGGWHFISLDGNNKGVSLDEEQMAWLVKDLDGLAPNTPVLLMSHYPIMGVTPYWEGGMHSDYKELKTLFYKHKDKIKVCLSGHQHLQDSASYNGVQYFCNGAVSGFWWGKGNEKSAAPYYYEETPPGYAILKLYADGSLENHYYPVDYGAAAAGI
jgi:Icc protein